MKIKVLLIVPKFSRLFEEAPLGIMYIAAVIRQAGHKVELLDGSLTDLRENLIPKSFKSGLPQVIGLTCTTLTYPLVMELADWIGESYPDITIIIGGVHATIMPETLLEDKNIDYCVIGEGESTIIELLNYVEKRSFGEPRIFPAIEEIDGIAFLQNDKIHFNSLRAPIDNLDSLPFPARDLLNKEYFKNRRTTIMASRGCPGNCSYCQPTLRTMFGNAVRRRSVQNVIDEMLEMYEKFDIRYFKFFDDTFTSDKAWVMDFCEKVVNNFKGKHICLDCLTRVNSVDFEMLKAMKSAGFYVIDFGAESGSQRILNYYRKGTTVEQSIEACKLCKKSGIKSHTCLMIGAPIETMEDINATKKLIKKMNPDSICVSITTPMPHTAMWDECIKNGALSEDDWQKVADYLQKWGGVCQNISERELFKLKQEIQRNFWLRRMFNPKHIYNFMRYHDVHSALRDARYFLWKGDYS